MSPKTRTSKRQTRLASSKSTPKYVESSDDDDNIHNQQHHLRKNASASLSGSKAGPASRPTNAQCTTKVTPNKKDAALGSKLTNNSRSSARQGKGNIGKPKAFPKSQESKESADVQQKEAPPSESFFRSDDIVPDSGSDDGEFVKAASNTMFPRSSRKSSAPTRRISVRSNRASNVEVPASSDEECYERVDKLPEAETPAGVSVDRDAVSDPSYGGQGDDESEVVTMETDSTAVLSAAKGHCAVQNVAEEVVEGPLSKKKRTSKYAHSTDRRPSASPSASVQLPPVDVVTELKVLVQAQAARLEAAAKDLALAREEFDALKKQHESSSGSGACDRVGAPAGASRGTRERHNALHGTSSNGSNRSVVKQENDSSSKSCAKQNGKKLTTLTRYEAVMNPLVPLLDVVFCNDNLQVCLLRCTLQEFLDNMEGTHNELQPAGLVHVLQTLMFSRKANQTKEENSKGAGPRGNAFLLKVMCLCVSMSQLNKFGQFKDENNTSAEMDMPSWLCAGEDGNLLIRPAHFSRVMEWKNVSGGSKEYYKERAAIGNKRSLPGANDIAFYAVDKGVEVLKKIVHNSREMSPMNFLRVFGYLFQEWSLSADVRVDSSSISMVWVEDTEQPLTDMDPIPKMKMFFEEGAHEFNEATFDEFVSKRSDLVINITHDLPVRGPGSSARNPGEVTKKKFSRPVNLMRVALQVLYSYCVPKRNTSEYIVLSGHEHSALVVFNMARAMRRLFLTRQSPSISLPGQDHCTSADVIDMQDRLLTLQDTFLKSVTPSVSHINRILVSVLSVVSLKTFDRMNDMMQGTGQSEKDGSDAEGNGSQLCGGGDSGSDGNVTGNIMEKMGKLAW